MASDRASTVIDAADVRAAASRIRGLVDPSPVIRSPWLSDIAGRPVWLKLENLQPAGSFKIRGAANRMLALSAKERAVGVITCSGGNHGAAVAYIAQRLGVGATVCVPTSVDPVKLRAIEEAGAEAVVAGATFDEALEGSFRLARERGLVYVHPFDDPYVIAGQGTIGLEIMDQVPNVAAVAAAVSGGGLIGGIGAAVKGAAGGGAGGVVGPACAAEGAGPTSAASPAGGSAARAIRVLGVSAERASAMAQSAKAGVPVDVPHEDTLAEVLAGTIGLDNRHSLATVRAYVDAHILVGEESIAEAMIGALRRHRIVVEGGGAVPIAAVLAGLIPDDGPGRPADAGTSDGALVLVVSGGNVDPAAILALE